MVGVATVPKLMEYEPTATSLVVQPVAQTDALRVRD
jgi:hypothetical protein